MPIVFLLLHLLSSHMHIFTARADHVVAAICARVPDGFVFAHQHDSNLGRESTQGPRIDGEVDMVPGSAVCEAGLFTRLSDLVPVLEQCN